MNIVIKGNIESRAIEQLRRCMTLGDVQAGVLCANRHLITNMPIVMAGSDIIDPYKD